MTFSVDGLPLELPSPETISTLVCCDLDETYIPFAPENKPDGGVTELEAFLLTQGVARGLLLGWITGSNLSSALRKAEGYISHSPHFICCSLGTEFYWVRKGQLVPSASWQERIQRSGYRQDNVAELVKRLLENGIRLEKQSGDYQGQYKTSFYYRSGPTTQADIAKIESFAAAFKIRAMLSRSNPAAGDPADCYDADFIPLCCGKDQAVLFLRNRLNLPKSAVLAFGDSANDFPMFAQAGQGYLVANADIAATHPSAVHLDKPYCHGILSILAEAPA